MAGKDLALVMSGGGARAAYQVGVLRSMARHHPDLELPILTGVSAGAINAAFLANRVASFPDKAEELVRLWEELRVEHVFKVSGFNLFTTTMRWGMRLLSGGRAPGAPMRSMVDTAPLWKFLEHALQADEGRLTAIDENLRTGHLKAVAITGSSYTTGQTVTWVQGREIESWERPQRRADPAQIGLQHVMASSALPLLFPAVVVGGAWYGDGGIRLSAPLSPAVHLGAGKIMAISTRYGRSAREAALPELTGYPPPAQVAGSLLNAIFLDLLDGDAMRLQRINRLLETVPPEKRDGLRKIDLLILRPSRDLGRLANDYEAQLPRAFRFLTRGLGTKETRSNDMLSLVMFQPDYLKCLIEMGEADAEARQSEIGSFLAD